MQNGLYLDVLNLNSWIKCVVLEIFEDNRVKIEYYDIRENQNKIIIVTTDKIVLK